MNAQDAQRNVPPEQASTVISWLQQNSISIEHIEAGNGFADLQPLKQVLKDAKVVGLGETTHGTREFFQFKHRMVEFLVTEMNFTGFALEASYASCQPINEYILSGKGDRDSVLTGQWYVVWDTEEMAALIDWMRAYNQTVPDEKKVRFYGVDINRNGPGWQVVIDYLRKLAPDKLSDAESLFETLGAVEAKWPRQIDEEDQKTLERLFPRLQGLIDYLKAHEEMLVGTSSQMEYDQILRYLHVTKQWTIANAPNLLQSSLPEWALRTMSMAENLNYLIDQSALGTKFILWEHNFHIGVDDAENPNMGYILRQTYGKNYFALGFYFNQGAFLTRMLLLENLLGDLKEVLLPPAPEGTLSWYLSRIGADVFIANLRAPTNNSVVEQWLNNPQPARNVTWFYDETAHYFAEYQLGKRYDGIFFVERTTASHPTANALQTVARRDGL